MELLVDINPIYMKIWNLKKIFIKRIIVFSIRFTNILIKLIKYFLKFTLKHTLIYILRITPLYLKKKIKEIIKNNSNLFFLAKRIRYWLIIQENFNQVLQTNLIVYFIIRKVLFSIFRFSLNNPYARSVILNEIKMNMFIKTELDKILKEVNLSKVVGISTFLLYRNENLEISHAEEEIYRDLKIFSTET